MFKSKKINIFLIYALAVCFIYPAVIFFGKTLIPNLYYPQPFGPSGYKGCLPVNSFNIDLATPAFYELPVNRTVGDMYLKGEFPLWNPYQGCGSSLAAQYSTRVFFPYQIAENISPYWTWDYFMLFRLVIAAFFTYLFLRLLNLSTACAFLGGLAYSLSGSFIWFINLEQFTNVAMMVPVCLFSLERFLQFKKGRYAAEVAIVFALLFLAGQPEIAIYVMVLAAVYYFFRVLTAAPRLLSVGKAVLKFIGMVILGLGLAAFLILPFLELILNAYQCHPLGGNMGIREPTSLQVAISVLIPSLFELPTYYRIFPHNGVWDWLGGYSGVLVFFLILLGFFQKGRQRKFFLFFSLFGFFIILKNFGFPLVSWIGRLPLLDQSWSPRWAGPVWTFSLAVSAALGLEAMLESPRRNRALFWRITGLVLIITGLLCYKTTYFSQFKDLDAAQLKVVLPPILGGVIVGGFVLFTATWLLCYCQNNKGLVRGIIFLAILELSFYIPRGMGFPWTAFKLIPFLLGIITVFLLTRERWRLSLSGVILVILSGVLIGIKSPSGFPDRHNPFEEAGSLKFLKEKDEYYRIVAGEGILMPNLASSFRLFDIRYISSLSSLSYQNYVDSYLLEAPHTFATDRLWFTGLSDLKTSNLRSFYQEIEEGLDYYSYLGVKYILALDDIELGLPLVYDAEVKIYENPQVFPRVYLVGNFEIASSFQEAQELMASPDFDLEDSAVLEKAPPGWYKVSASGYPESRAWIEQYTPNQVKIAAELESDALLVFTDVFYPGWRAYTQEGLTDIYRVNGLTRGVFLKRGKHDIIFKYFPFSFQAGLIIALVSLLICAGFILGDKPESGKI